MPSRARSRMASRAFSYYDHVFLPESEKDLTWAHRGRSYKLAGCVRVNGKRKTEAFLFELDRSGSWNTVVLDDGTVSDGKVDTYDALCRRAVCGSADTFFTSVFSAQGKRQLSAPTATARSRRYWPTCWGRKRSGPRDCGRRRHARLLKASLGAMRQELAGVDEEGRRIANERGRLRGAEDRVARRLSERQAAQATLEVADSSRRNCWPSRTSREAPKRAARSWRASVLPPTSPASRPSRRSRRRTGASSSGWIACSSGSRTAHRRSAAAGARCRIADASACDALKQAQVVRRAARRLPLAEIVLAARVATGDYLAPAGSVPDRVPGRHSHGRTELSATLREAGQAAIRADDLARRFGLTSAVPCAGTDLQGQCQLLGDAREASTLIPSAKAAMARLAREKASIDAELATLRSQREALSGAPMTLSRSEVECERARARVARLAQWSARSAEMAQARAALTEIDQELAGLHRPVQPMGNPWRRPRNRRSATRSSHAAGDRQPDRAAVAPTSRHAGPTDMRRWAPCPLPLTCSD
jgi:exonuclease SbcC